MPARAAVGRHFNRRDSAASVGLRCPCDRLPGAVFEARAFGGLRDRCTRRGAGRGFRAREQARYQRSRLRAHFGEQVDRELLHVRIGGVARGVGGERRPRVDVCQPPGPLNRTGPEHQCPAWRAVEREVMGRGTRFGDVAAIVDERLQAAHGRFGELELAGWPKAVFNGLVPLVAQRAGARGEHQRLTGHQRGDRCVAPQAELAVAVGHCQVGGAGVDQEVLPGQRAFGLAAVGWRAEARVAPAARPGRRVFGVDGGIEVGLLVGD